MKKNTLTFPRGVHPAGNKELTREKPVERMTPPEVLYVPLSQSIGRPPEPEAAVGDRVLRGRRIAVKTAAVSANVFSPVSGTVKAIVNRRLASGAACPHFEIENDGKYEEAFLEPLAGPTPAEIAGRVEEAGIVGMGGAAFPTSVKLRVPEGKRVDTLVINAAECEPYLTCDERILLERTEDFLAGVALLAKALNADNAVVGVESNKPEALAALQAQARGIAVVPLKTKYPQGGERQLIYAVTGRRVPLGGLPADAGVAVQNVQTALAVYEAVALGKPSYERVLTVSGRGIATPKNVLAATGTTYAQLAEFCGGASPEVKKVLSGGPMTGFAQPDLNAAVTKAASGVLFLTEDELNNDKAMACINCGRCAAACPMRLMPMFIDTYTLCSEYATAKRYGAMACIECGCCAYVCPSKRPLVQSIRLAKKLIKERNI